MYINVNFVPIFFSASGVNAWAGVLFYLARNSLFINACWTGSNEARIQWEDGGRDKTYNFLTRKVVYEDASKSPVYGIGLR